jgi:hypothetical protein
MRVIATSNALPFICGHYPSAKEIAVRFPPPQWTR